METKDGLPVKVPMSLAVTNLAQIMEAVDAGELNDTITKMFNETRLDVAAAIDRRICFFDIANGQMETCKKLSVEYAEAAKRIGYVIKKVSEGTIQIILSGPEGYTYQGNLGRLQPQNNAHALEHVIPTKSKSISNSITHEDAEKFKVPAKYLTQVTTLQLNTEAIKEDLKNGEKLPWATLTQGKQLRIYRK